MDSKINNSISSLCLVCLFFVGNTVINLPLSYGTNAALIGFVLAFIVSLPFLKVMQKQPKSENGVFFKSAEILFVVYALFCGIVTLRNYVTFSDKIILPEISNLFPTVIFLLLLWLICREKNRVLFKIAIISAISVTVITVLMFVLSLDGMSVKMLLPNEFPKLKEIGYQALAYLSMSFIEGIVLTGIIKDNKKTILHGYAWGAALLLIVLIQCILLFGYNLTERLIYPFASAMSVITFGDKFSRMEGFSYLIYFCCTLVKTAVCIKSAKVAFIKIFPSAQKYFFPVVFTVYGCFSVFTRFFVNLPFLTVAPFLLLPAPLILLLKHIPNRKQL